MSSPTDTLLNVGPVATAATPPTSQIDPTIPIYGQPTTQSVRDNFATAQTEITGLLQATQGGPFIPAAGGHFTGPVYLYNDPTDVMMPVTLGYFDAHGGGGSGGGGIPEAPTDGQFYTRSRGAWVPGVALSGGAQCQMTADLFLAGNPTNALAAVPKQYADAIATTANAAVPLAGGTMTGLLVLSGDPSAPLGAVTKQYADAGLATKANIANPSFTGTLTATSRVNIAGPDGVGTCPVLMLNDTTGGRPVFGVYNNNGLFSIGLASPGSGNPNGNPLAQMDQTGQWTLNNNVTLNGNLLLTGHAITGGSSMTFQNGGAVGQNGTGWVLQGGVSGAGGTAALYQYSTDPFWRWQTGAGTPATLDSTGTLTLGYTSGSGALNFSNGTRIYPLASSAGFSLYGGGYAFNLVPESDPVWRWVTGTGTPMSLTTSGRLSLTGPYSAVAFNNGSSFSPLAAGGYSLYGGSYAFNIQSDAEPVYRWVSSLGTPMSLVSNGNLTILGALTQGSDRRLKTDIEDAAHGIEIVRGLLPKTFRRVTTPDECELGFVAQDIEAILPEAVREMPGAPDDENDKILGIVLSPLVAVLTNAVKQMDDRLTKLEGKRK